MLLSAPSLPELQLRSKGASSAPRLNTRLTCNPIATVQNPDSEPTDTYQVLSQYPRLVKETALRDSCIQNVRDVTIMELLQGLISTYSNV